MTEATLTQGLLVALRGQPDFVVDKLSDRFSVGIPDIAVTHWFTWWLEVKYFRKSCREMLGERSAVAQLHSMRRRADCGRARYVIYQSTPTGLTTKLVNPWKCLTLDELFLRIEDTPPVKGHGHDEIVNYIREMSPWTTLAK